MNTNFDANVHFILLTKIFYGHDTVSLVAAEAKKLRRK